ncbi:3-oxoacyl-[acyl-carrier protein] reductase [Hymenobacter luteus]|uniref:3-oxoacyl-[acyl-carrier protein] reductase n=2 Tax=Hymenobacter TaxID=89966 RepID=A0A7W9SXB8_9BACT|nr:MULTISPECIES: 3-ketoacyl-ACP reductase [Hymenobacter]MBB4600497.1 3-oxoacyl-[acyl-carrier protein] reductase [Hymenobacter latericoloratus]MBB6057193.1 3-oxoacyl-[acyl-carrier protein] reductase [Hymenobacter luteus]
MESLAGKNALVTGAGKGIGRAVAVALAQEGANVALLARTESQLREVAQEIEALGVKAVVVTADVADRTAAEAAVNQALQELGSIDILINNAGIGTFAKLVDMDPEEWENIIRVNLLGTYYITRAVLPQMIQRESGDIINIASTAGQRGAATTSAYSASKFALLGLTESLMQEVRKQNIRVSALTPSTVATELAINNKLTDGNPEKVMQPEDLAEFIISQLKLNRRIFIKEAGMWSTNP